MVDSPLEQADRAVQAGKNDEAKDRLQELEAKLGSIPAARAGSVATEPAAGEPASETKPGPVPTAQAESVATEPTAGEPAPVALTEATAPETKLGLVTADDKGGQTQPPARSRAGSVLDWCKTAVKKVAKALSTQADKAVKALPKLANRAVKALPTARSKAARALPTIRSRTGSVLAWCGSVLSRAALALPALIGKIGKWTAGLLQKAKQPPQEKTYSCLACGRLFSALKSNAGKCEMCDADNGEWQKLKNSGWVKKIGYLKYFPIWFYLGLGLVLGFGFYLLVNTQPDELVSQSLTPRATTPTPTQLPNGAQDNSPTEPHQLPAATSTQLAEPTSSPTAAPTSFLESLQRFLRRPQAVAFLTALIIALLVYFLKFALRDRELLRQVRKKPRRPGLLTYAALSLAAAILCAIGISILLWLTLYYLPPNDWIITMLDQETGEFHTLVKDNGQVLSPSWSPIEEISSTVGISITPAISPTPEASPTPEISPTKEIIVFASNLDGDWEIRTVNADGTGPRNVTDNAFNDFAPCWSRDGEKIVFASDRSGFWEIWEIDRDGSNPRKLSGQLGRVTDIACSPDSKTVAFVEAFPGFSIWFGDQIKAAKWVPGTFHLLLAVFLPLLTLALMLAGVKSFTDNLNEKFPRPIYLNSNKLAEVALKSLGERLKVNWRDLRIISMSRAESGGLNMTVGQPIQSLKKINGTPDEKRVPDEKRYDVEVDEWAYILSLKELKVPSSS